MVILPSSDLWCGSDPSDIEAYLVTLTRSEGAYPVSSYRPVVCKCGSDAFHVARACEVTQLSCTQCDVERYVLDCPEGWEEAVEEEGSETIVCIGCGTSAANVGAGFAGYDSGEGIKWCYVGLRCITCGGLSCVNDFKVARGPAETVYDELKGF